jgi:hypothetical protein
MTKMARQNMLPRRITKILNHMDKLHTKPPMCNDCCGAKATRRPWRSKSAKHNQRHLKKATHPGDVISVDQLESSIPRFIGQMTGKLTRQRIVASTVFVDHASDFSYVYHQTSMTSESIEDKGRTISFCGVGAHHQNGITEKRIGDLQRRATTLLLHAQRRWPDAINTHLWTYAF